MEKKKWEEISCCFVIVIVMFIYSLRCLFLSLVSELGSGEDEVDEVGRSKHFTGLVFFFCDFVLSFFFLSFLPIVLFYYSYICVTIPTSLHSGICTSSIFCILYFRPMTGGIFFFFASFFLREREEGGRNGEKERKREVKGGARK